MAGKSKKPFKLNLLGIIKIDTEIDEESRFTKNVIISLIAVAALIAFGVPVTVYFLIKAGNAHSWGAAGLAGIGGITSLIAAVIKNKS